MLAAMSPGKARLTAVLAGLLMTLGLAGTAHADPTPGSWTTPAALPSGATTSTDQILSSPTGQLYRYASVSGRPAVAEFTAAGLGTPTFIPGSNSSDLPGPVAFEADGTAIFSYFVNGGGLRALVARLPNGTFGTPLVLNRLDPSQYTYQGINSQFGSHVDSLAVRPGEVLLAGRTSPTTPPYGLPQLSVLSLTLGADGTMALPAGVTDATPVYKDLENRVDKNSDVPYLALDPSGTATLVVSIDHVGTQPGQQSTFEILQIQRDASGAWSTPTSLSAGVTNDAWASSLHAASTPSGRAIVSFQTSNGTPQQGAVYQSIREPGGPFATPQPIVNVQQPTHGSIISYVKVAAGGDGTLAVGANTVICASDSSKDVQQRAMQVVVAAPGKPAATSSVAMLSSSTTHSSFGPIGAGGGQAIVGLADSIDHTVQPDGSNVCGQDGDHSTDYGTVNARSVMIGEHAGAPTTYATGSYNSANSSTNTVPTVDAVGISCTGNAAATGQLLTRNAYSYAFYAAAADFQATCAGSTPNPTPTPTPAATPDPGTGVTPGPAPAPTPAITPPPTINTTTGSISPTANQPKLNADGTVTVTITAPHSDDPGFALGEHIAIQVFAGASGHGARATAARATSTKKSKPKKTTKPKLIGSVSKSVKLKSGQSLKVKLTLSSKLKTYVKANKKALVVLQITSTQAGRTPSVTTKTIKH